jgi:aryl-alcohol dehydrogenase-like predicted oxidoreductase
MGMSEFYGPLTTRSRLARARTRAGLGITFYDTADMYGSGHNEECWACFIAGSARLARDRHQVRHPPQSPDSYVRSFDNSPATCRARFGDASLKRLGIDYIDLFYIHRSTPRDLSRKPPAAPGPTW